MTSGIAYFTKWDLGRKAHAGILTSRRVPLPAFRASRIRPAGTPCWQRQLAAGQPGRRASPRLEAPKVISSSVGSLCDASKVLARGWFSHISSPARTHTWGQSAGQPGGGFEAATPAVALKLRMMTILTWAVQFKCWCLQCNEAAMRVSGHAACGHLASAHLWAGRVLQTAAYWLPGVTPFESFAFLHAPSAASQQARSPPRAFVLASVRMKERLPCDKASSVHGIMHFSCNTFLQEVLSRNCARPMQFTFFSANDRGLAIPTAGWLVAPRPDCCTALHSGITLQKSKTVHHRNDLDPRALNASTAVSAWFL